MRFANSEYLWLLLLNFLIFYLSVLRRSNSSKILFPSSKIFKIASKKRSLRQKMTQWAVVLKIVAFSCLVIALARPQSLSGTEYIKTDIIDIIITIDTSLSMGAKDFQSGTRLQVAKEMIEKFINMRKADRLGLITFAAYSQLRCPLTLDTEVVKSLLADIDLVDRNDLEANGTAIGVALASSVDHLRKSGSKSRVVILMTDGDNNVTTIEPQTSSDIAKVMGVKVYTIGIGKEGLVPMPSTNPSDPAGTYKLQQAGFNEEILRQIANTTGGKYFRATDRKSLEDVFQSIDSLERTTTEVRRYERYREQFFFWVVAGVAFLIADLILQHTYLKVLP
ncbi:MAG: VWA domain-containing protein [Blastocatellia bacterium]|nr:VWA domain-containing protein [Blastocatellia bacterium]